MHFPLPTSNWHTHLTTRFVALAVLPLLLLSSARSIIQLQVEDRSNRLLNIRLHPRSHRSSGYKILSSATLRCISPFQVALAYSRHHQICRHPCPCGASSSSVKCKV